MSLKTEMSLKIGTLALALFAIAAPPAHGRSIKKLELAEGYTEVNTLSAPVLDGSGVAPLAFSELDETFDRGEPMFRRRSGVMRGGLKAKLGPAVRPGALLAACLRTEASRMGLRVGEGGWRIGGTIRELRFDNDVPSVWAMGAMLFYGSMVVDLEITDPEGQRSTTTLRLHSYSVQGGMNGFKSARDAVATHLIESAQEIVARLNRSHLHAPPHPDVASWTTLLRGRNIEDQEALVHSVGLSGSPEAVPILLRLLSSETDEGRRSHVINALAAIGSPEAVPVLDQRYATEDDDCRWYSLKALDYIGTEEAREVIRRRGLIDPEAYYRAVAKRILGN